jgi:proline iminopeptidase
MPGAPFSTAPFKGGDGQPALGSVAETHFLTLGGVTQWVMIRGRDAKNPVLVIVHGGPGMSETALFRSTNAALEDAFTVVYWDQRGAGRSLDRRADPSVLTVDRFVDDLGELVAFLGTRLGKAKVTLLGHSWGSVLGVLYAQRHPDKVCAYVGVGQVADMAASEAASYAFTLEQARKRGNARARKALEAIGAPPHEPKALQVQRRWLMAFGGGFGDHLSFAKLLWRTISAPEGSILDVPRLIEGANYSLGPLWPQLIAVDLQNHTTFKVPVFLILGRKDMQVVASVAAEWFERIEAPSKQLFWLEESGHFAPFEEPLAFNRILVEHVRAAAVANGG